jgi:hypothetical protein
MDSCCVKEQKVVGEGKERREGKLKKNINMRLSWQ